MDIREERRKFWDKVAKIYTGSMKSSEPLYREIADSIISDMTAGSKVLELAAGTGQISFFIAAHASSYTATDFSERMVEEARKQTLPENMVFEQADATDLQYDDRSFDTVIIANCLHIMPDPEKALSEIRRVLKDDGKLYCPTFTSSHSLIGKIRIKVMSLFGFKTFHDWEADDLSSFLGDNGFKECSRKLMGTNMMPLAFMSAVKMI